MRRFVLIPGALIFFVVWFAVFGIVQGHAGQTPRTLPGIPDRLRPGQPAPSGIACDYYVPDFATLYCTGSDDLSIIIADKHIKKTDLFIWYSGVTTGDLIAAWGDPIGATYEASGGVSLFWGDKAAYVLADHKFTPQSRVGFLEFGDVTKPQGAWRGFIRMKS